MSVYLISYDLNKTKDYESLYEAIKSCSYNSSWWHYLDSTWIIKSNMSVNSVSDKIKTAVDNDDNFLVIEVINNKQGWLPKEAWDYLNNVIFK